MLNAVAPASLLEEEGLVAELDLLGVSYLSRLAATHPAPVRPAEQLLAGLVRQSSARVREAVIAVLLAHPDLATSVPVGLADGLLPRRVVQHFGDGKVDFGEAFAGLGDHAGDAIAAKAATKAK